ncbi:MAG: 4-diphosphocytidyl-2-C-methyl-D-erythritol kinase, partial [Cyclobacteriaceae bacterium]
MLDFPNAKVNLGLNIVAKRPDGYHEIETCFLPIPWKDALEIVEAPVFKFTSTGLA